MFFLCLLFSTRSNQHGKAAYLGGGPCPELFPNIPCRPLMSFLPGVNNCDVSCQDLKELFKATDFGGCAQGEHLRGDSLPQPSLRRRPLSRASRWAPRKSSAQRHRVHLPLLAEPGCCPQRLICKEKIIHRVFTDSTRTNPGDSFVDTTFDKINTVS